MRHQRRPIVADEAAASPVITQNACLYQAMGITTFIEKILTTSVGSIIPIVISVRALMRMLRLLLIMEARASIREASTWE